MKNFIKMTDYLVPFLVFFCLNRARCQTDVCNFGTCGECISFVSERCVWCSKDVFDDRRCQPLSYLNTSKSWCQDAVVNPEPEFTVVKNETFSEKGNVTVQLMPQLIKMKARPGVKMDFEMSFKPAKDYPLDVYYLMDVSDTMRSKMKDLRDQAMQIHSDLTIYTNNVRLGIGSFVEKPGFPFFDPNKHKGNSFKNEVPLTSDMEIFQKQLDKITFGSNFDDPEAGLDALMQAMKCEDEVGWRNHSRRIIVLCTDSTYHSAGDGKIVGAIKPHDMKCHLENNTYSEALTYDYPSVSQINRAAADGNFRIIFAITQNNLLNNTPSAEYRQLADQIAGAKYAKLEGGKSVINIIKEAYEELTNTVEMKFQAYFPALQLPVSFVEITTNQKCRSETKINCELTHKQKILNVTGSLKVTSCPPNDLRNQAIVVKGGPEGLPDKLIINLEVDCSCDCEKSSDANITSDKCNRAGSLQCGICKCDEGRYGVDCRCNGSSKYQTHMEKCKLNPEDKDKCSGHGTCRCGKCEKCDSGYSGDFCQFNDFSCPKPNNKLCSGSEHGQCYRGQCQCKAHWTGADCSCSDNEGDCIAPYSKKVCSGNGKCVCGKCQCDAIAGKNETYSGAFCDSCEECAEQRCRELENYALCNYMHMNDQAFCDKENNGTTKEIDVFFVNKTEINGPKLFMAKWCKKELDSHNGTYMVFKYQYDNNALKITIQKELETPPKANIWIAAGSAVGLVLLIGILTVIIWKILVDIHDKKEYQKFSAEALAQGYDVSQNPLYQDPSINFSNPVYNNQCN